MKRSGPRKRRGLRALLCILLVLLTAAGLSWLHRSDPADVLPVQSDNPNVTFRTGALVSAHRCGAGLAPENTMMAFENCVMSEAFRTDVYEFDLHLTADGALVLLHDDTLDRTGDVETVFGEEKVRAIDKTFDELSRLNMGAKFTDADGNQPYAGLSGDAVPANLRIVRVETVLDYLTLHGAKGFIIEIKNGGKDGKRAADQLCEILQARGLFLGSFHGEVLRYVSRVHPELRRGAGIGEVLVFCFAALINKRDFRPQYTALQIPYRQFLLNLGNTKVINYAHKNGIAVQYWTVNNAKDAEYLASIGADCLMSDYPDRIYSALYGDRAAG